MNIRLGPSSGAAEPQWRGYTSRAMFVLGLIVTVVIAVTNVRLLSGRPYSGSLLTSGWPPRVIALGIVVAQALVLVAPRVPLAWFPLAVVGLTSLAYTPDFATGYIPHVVAFFAAGAHGSRRLQVIAAGFLTAFAMFAASATVAGGVARPDTRWPIVIVAVLAATILAGARNQEMQRGVHAAMALEQRERDEEIRQTVADERARIARELHDVLAHTVSVIAVQADAASSVLTTEPERARAAMTTVASLARQSLDEIRRLLGVLRSGDDARALGPQPGLHGLRELTEQTIASGVPVELLVDDVGRLPAGLDLCAYRIVQESLTNVRKHAGEARATVRVERRPDELVLDITDDGRGGSVDPTPGHGLIGMRERVALFGGRLEAGAQPGGGWRVLARLPLKEVSGWPSAS